MPEVAEVDTQQPTDVAVTTTEAPSLGWRAGLPDDLKQNTDLSTYKTVGDFTKDALTWKGKVGDLEKKLGDSIPKLPEGASEEDRATYFDALGRPKQASEYEFDGEDKTDPEWTNGWKSEFHKMGLTKAQAKQLTTSFNAQGQAYAAKQEAARKAEYVAAEQAFRSEVGDKYDTNVELAKRLWNKHGKEEFDTAFNNASGPVRFGTIRSLLHFASLTGEDTSPQAGLSLNKAVDAAGFDYSKSPKPPVK